MTITVAIQLENINGTTYVRLADSPAGISGVKEFKLSLNVEQVMSEMAQAFGSANQEQAALKRIGRKLYQALDQAEIGKVLRDSMQEARRRRELVTLQMQFDENTAELAALPWELLHDGRKPLLLSGLIDLTRYITCDIDSAPLTAQLPLRVLHVTADPQDRNLPSLNLEASRQSLRELQNLVVDSLDHATFDELMTRLTQPPYIDIIHFDGHGGMLGGHPVLYLEKDDHSHRCDPVSVERLAILFGQNCSLVVLNACLSSSITSHMTSVFEGLAPALIGAGVPSVVGMQFPIPDDAARRFIGIFYSELKQGNPLTRAMTAARRALAGDGSWYIPTLYLRADDPEGCLVQPAHSADAEPDEYAPYQHLYGRRTSVKVIQDFLGHRDESARMRFVTIYGAAGIGKTALAAHFKNRLSPQAIWVQAPQESESANWSALIRQIAYRLGLVEISKMEVKDSVPEIERAVLAKLKNERVVLILDGIDDFVGDARLLNLLELLAPADSGRVILTSDQPVTVSNRLEVELGPLALKDARALFIECWGRRADNLTPEQFKSVDDICELVGRHPLTIKVAGGQAAAWKDDTLINIQSQLRQELENPPKKHSLFEAPRSTSISPWAAIGLAVDRLSENARALLSRCSVFPGEFDQDGMVSMAHARPEIDLVTARGNLIDLRLLSVGAGSQVYSLQPVIRAYARTLVSDEAYRHLASIAGRRLIQTHADAVWLQGLILLAEAEDWEGALPSILARYSDVENPDIFSSPTLEVTISKARFYHALANVFDKRGDTRRADQYAHQCLELLETSPGSVETRFLSLRLYAILIRNTVRQRKLEESNQWVTRALATIDEIPSGETDRLAWERGQNYLAAGIFFYYNQDEGDHGRKAEQYTRNAQAIYKQLDDTRQHVVALSNRSTIVQARGELNQSRKFSQQVLNILKRSEKKTTKRAQQLSRLNPAEIAFLRSSEYANLVDILTKMGEFESAVRVSREGLGSFGRMEFAEPHRALLINSGILNCEAGMYEEAERNLRAADEYSRRESLALYQVQLEAYLALVTAGQGHNQKATELITQAHKRAEDSGDVDGLAEAHYVNARIRLQMGDQDGARDQLLGALKLCDENELVYLGHRISLELGQLEYPNLTSATRETVQHAEAYFETAGANYYAGKARELLA
jgi:CHAT domain-containing protein/tetratricopeptide (TPR) repeat protein